MNWQEEYKNKLIPVDAAAALIESGDKIGMSTGPSMPIDVLESICMRRSELEDVTIISGTMMPPTKERKANHLEKKYIGHINHMSIFLGAYERIFLKEGNVGVIPMQLSRSEDVLDEHPVDVAILECSSPDENGNMSFGPSGMFANYIWVKQAPKIIIQVNKRVPYVYGEKAFIHVSDVSYICEKDRELSVPLNRRKVSEMEETIASYLINEIPDGATLQLGIGGISNAVGFMLKDKNDLGIHTEMLTDSLVDLAQKGVVNGRRKTFHLNKTVFAFAAGERSLYDFIDRNPDVMVAPASYVNNVNNIAKNDNMISINNTLSIDLTGQVCSETIGFNQYSGTGGQVDFVRGSQLSKGGKSFITLQSTANTSKGVISTIMTQLPPGTVVTTPRTEIQYVVTEYGIVNLKGKSIPDRVRALISIAHPNFRDSLTQEAKEAGLIF